MKKKTSIGQNNPNNVRSPKIYNLIHPYDQHTLHLFRMILFFFFFAAISWLVIFLTQGTHTLSIVSVINKSDTKVRESDVRTKKKFKIVKSHQRWDLAT